MSKVKADLGGRLRLGGLGLLFCSMLIYALAVDRTWYAVDGVDRLAAESSGLARWRFVAHVLGLSNGGMRGQSWAFLAFPAMFWLAIVLIVVGTVAVRRSPDPDGRPGRALALLRGRRPVDVASRHKSFLLIRGLLGAAGLMAIAAIITLRSAPAAGTLTDAQLTAGNWRMRLDEMRDDQRLIVEDHIHGQNGGRVGDVLSAAEASNVIQQNSAERAQVDAIEENARQRCRNVSDSGQCFDQALIAGSMHRPPALDALTKADVGEHVASATTEWQSVLTSLDRVSLVGIAMCILSLVLLAIAAVVAPRVVAAEFRGFNPEAEDPMYARYTRFGRALVGGSVVAALVGVACAGGAPPGGISVAIVAAMFAFAVGTLAVARVLNAPRALARARDAQIAATIAVASHDRAKLAEIATLDATASAKQHYAATLHASGSPPDLIAKAQAELQQAQEMSAQLRAGLLEFALHAVRGRLHAASTQQRALHAQSAPPEAFGTVDAATQAAEAEIAQLAIAAGWSPWPLTPSESAPPEAVRLTPVRPIIGAVALVIVVGAVAALSRPRDKHEGAASGAASVQGPAPTRDARCDSMLTEYQHALSAAGDSAGALPEARCATTDAAGDLVPPAQLSSQCQDLWNQHFANAQRAIDLNGQARAACPEMMIQSIGVVPPSLRVDARPTAGAPGASATASSGAPAAGPWATAGTATAATQVPSGPGCPETTKLQAMLRSALSAPLDSTFTITGCAVGHGWHGSMLGIVAWQDPGFRRVHVFVDASDGHVLGADKTTVAAHERDEINTGSTTLADLDGDGSDELIEAWVENRRSTQTVTISVYKLDGSTVKASDAVIASSEYAAADPVLSMSVAADPAHRMIRVTGRVPMGPGSPDSDLGEHDLTFRDGKLEIEGQPTSIASVAQPGAALKCPRDMASAAKGTFSMGSPDGVGNTNENPRHEVTVSAFCIDRTEVTAAAYAKCVGLGACSVARTGGACNGGRPDRADHPINCVSWDQATAYCAWNKRRLPTEAEWEYAARGTDDRQFPWGNDPPTVQRLNACGGECKTDVKLFPEPDGWAETAAVGSFPAGASPFGALDMAGNVWEWVSDWYGPYSAGAVVDPKGPASGKMRVYRGGGWGTNDADTIRVARRRADLPSNQDDSLGFRCAGGAP